MLKFMRRHAKSWIIKAAFAIIIIVFVFWGVGSFRARRATILAYVNGEPIYYKEFYNTYRQVLENYRARFKEFDEEWIKRLNLKQTVLEQLIERKLILQAAKKMGLMVSDMELWETISNYKIFQKDGKFDLKRYQMVLSHYHYTPAEFEQSLREDLIIKRIREIFKDLAQVSDLEAYETYRWLNQKINLEFVTFEPNQFIKEIKPKETDLKKYFEDHKERYEIPRKLKLVYLKISSKEFLEKINLTDEEIEKYYEANKDIFYEPKKVCARHILFRVASDAPKEKVEKVKKKAEEVLSKLKKGEDFVKLAKEYSEDKATAERGGDLGCFPRGVMVKSFEDAVFSLKKGEISEPIRTKLGFHIVKVYDIKEERTKPLKEVKKHIIMVLKKEKAKEMAFNTANRIYAEAILENDLRKAAKKYKKTIQETDFFSEKNWPLQIPHNLKDQILSLKKGGISSPLKSKESYFLIQLKDEKPKHLPTFDEVKEKVKEDFIKEEARKRAKEKAEKTLNALKKGEKIKLKWTETGFFSPDEPIPKIGFYLKQKELFFLDKNQPYFNDIAEIGNKFYLFKLKSRKKVNKADYEKEKEEFKKRLLIRRQIALFQAWVRQLREKAEIKIRKEML